MRRRGRELSLRFYIWQTRTEVGVGVNGFEVKGHIHKKDWGLGLHYWTPAALQVTVGPFSLMVGVSYMQDFYGPGIGFVKDRVGGWYPVAYLSDKLWWEGG